MQKAAPGDLDGRTNAELIAEKVVAAARAGDLKAAEICGDRAEGKPAQSMTVNERPRAHVVKPQELTAEEWARRYDPLADDEDNEEPS